MNPHDRPNSPRPLWPDLSPPRHAPEPLTAQTSTQAAASAPGAADTASARPSPQIIRVLPPDGPAVSIALTCGLSLWFGGLTLAGAVFAGVAWRSGATAGIISLGVLSMMFAIMTLIFSGIVRRQNRLYAEARRAFLERLTPLDEPSDPAIAEKLTTLWTKAWKPPTPKQIRAVVDEASPAGRARIICLGLVDVPEVGHFFFEPEIITPTRFYGKRLIFVPVAAAILGIWVLQLMRVIPGKVINLGSFGYLVGIGISWFWRTVIHPTYLRMAPGVIEALQFSHRGKKPLIRSYPMLEGTVAVVLGAVRRGKPAVRSITLLRADQNDELPLHRMGERERSTQRAWEALCSTVPTPALSGEELLG